MLMSAVLLLFEAIDFHPEHVLLFLQRVDISFLHQRSLIIVVVGGAVIVVSPLDALQQVLLASTEPSVRKLPSVEMDLSESLQLYNQEDD